MSRLRVFAGPNGSGKSTLYKQVSSRFNTGAFVNADLIEQEISRTGFVNLGTYGISVDGDEFELYKKNKEVKSLLKKAQIEGLPIDISLKENFLVDKSKRTHSYESALAALFIRTVLISRKKTFSFETVMSHPSKVAELQNAAENGFKVYLYFVCTDDPLVNIQRVENRVEKGGHPVQDDRIFTRYYKALENLFAAIRVSYRTYLFDNSGNSMTLVAEIFSNELIIRANKIPNWVENYVLKYYKP